jgi:hypothetical protein
LPEVARQTNFIYFIHVKIIQYFLRAIYWIRLFLLRLEIRHRFNLFSHEMLSANSVDTIFKGGSKKIML